MTSYNLGHFETATRLLADQRDLDPLLRLLATTRRSNDGDGVPILRFMDWQKINIKKGGKPRVWRWSDLPSESADWTYDGGAWHRFRGVPLAVCVAFANDANARPWLNIPTALDDAGVRRFVDTAIRDSKHRPIFEYSNELWNRGMFGQHKFAAQRGDGSFRAALAYQVRRTAFIYDACEGAADVAVAAQCMYRGVADALVSYGAADVADYLAIAPYAGQLHSQFDPRVQRDLWRLDLDLWSFVRGALADAINAHATLASDRGMKLIAYEGGQHLQINASTQHNAATFAAWNGSPLAVSLLRYLRRVWRERGGGAFVEYSFLSAWGSDFWGMIDASDGGARVARAV